MLLERKITLNSAISIYVKCDPCGRVRYDPRENILATLFKGLKMMLHTKYLNFKPRAFRTEDLIQFSFINNVKH